MATTNDTPTRRCSKCRQRFPLTSEYFQSDASRKYGLAYLCKSCNNKRTHDYFQEHRDERLQYGRDWYERNREIRLAQSRDYHYRTPDYQRARKQAYYQLNRARCLAVGRLYVKNNPDKTKARRKRYFALNPEKYTQNNQARRARLQQAKGSHTAKDIRLQIASQKELCWWCGKPFNPTKYHVDHRIPLDKGGSNDARNIVISHPGCNLSKSNKFPWEWIGRLL